MAVGVASGPSTLEPKPGVKKSPNALPKFATTPAMSENAFARAEEELFGLFQIVKPAAIVSTKLEPNSAID